MKLYFKNPYLELKAPERFIARLSKWLIYSSLFASATVFLFSEIKALNASALIIFFFLIDRAIFSKKSELTLSSLKLSKKDQELNISPYFSPKSIRLIELAKTKAKLNKSDISLQLFQLLLREKKLQAAFSRLEIPISQFLSKANSYLEKSTRQQKEAEASTLDLLTKKAFKSALNHYSSSVEEDDLFSALGHLGNQEIDKLYQLFEIDPVDIENALVFNKRKIRKRKHFFARSYRVKEKRMNRAWTARPTPTLDMLSVDITDLVRGQNQGFLIGHAVEYDRLVDVLSKGEVANALLVGQPGSGRDVIVEHLAFEINKDRVPRNLFDKRIVALDVSALNSNSAQGSMEDKVKKLTEEIQLAGNIILYIPEIHEMVKTSGPSTLNAADALLPNLRSAGFPVIGSSYPSEYRRYLEENSSFKDAFDLIRVKEISEEEAIRYLSYQATLLEQEFSVQISFSAVRKSVELGKKYFRQRMLPKSAEELLKEAISDASEKAKETLTAQDIIEVAQKRITVPLERAKKDEAKELLKLEEKIHEHYIDQEEAVKAVANSLRQYRAGLSNKKGPISSFLFVGPTGVGKTELSKILAKLQFGSVEAMKRFDMSEYQNQASVYQLIGSPDASVSGTLTEAVRLQPYSLVLLDEFEKAHPDLLNLFLQVLDDGRLTDNLGRTIDFKNTIIIATSNAHSNLIKEEIEKGTPIQNLQELIKKRLNEYFKPELINRFSKIVVFKNLSPEDIIKIVKLQVDELIKQLKEEHGATLSLSPSALQAIATQGFDPVYGARPIKALITDKIKSLLSSRILEGKLERGESWQISFQDGQFQSKELSSREES